MVYICQSQYPNPSHSTSPSSFLSHFHQPVNAYSLVLCVYPERHLIWYILLIHWASLVAQGLKCLPPMWETCVWSLGWEDPLEKEMATHSSILAWRIPWLEEPDRLQSMGSQRVGHDWATSLSLYWFINIEFIVKCTITHTWMKLI